MGSKLHPCALNIILAQSTAGKSVFVAELVNLKVGELVCAEGARLAAEDRWASSVLRLKVSHQVSGDVLGAVSAQAARELEGVFTASGPPLRCLGELL